MKKFYLVSAATGVGKTRYLLQHCVSIACDEIYDTSLGKWVSNGTKEPSMYITTEQEIDEIQTMVLAFLSGVDENHIIYNAYTEGELERVLYAAELVKKSPLYIKKLPDFALKDIENTIKYGIREWGVKYIFVNGECKADNPLDSYIHDFMRYDTDSMRIDSIKEFMKQEV